ncbi:MAG: hypothetical protein DRJ45_02785, partial [Thermoprotei archaeon]
YIRLTILAVDLELLRAVSHRVNVMLISNNPTYMHPRIPIRFILKILENRITVRNEKNSPNAKFRKSLIGLVKKL